MDANRLPLYLALAQTLRQEINAEHYTIGSHLPPEDQLVEKYGVSRHTVRQALRELKDEGLIISKAGIGTIVSARPDAAQFFSGIETISDLLQFVEATKMHVISQSEIIADAKLSSQLHCPIGQVWTSIKILRKVPQTKLPLCFLEVLIWPEDSDVLLNRKVVNQPIYSLLEKRRGLRVVEVQQEITASNLSIEMALALNAQEGQSAMRITRFYYDSRGDVFEIGIGHYPSGRYVQRTKFKAQIKKLKP
jgi:DNA-binding GntR family transcriptional regulator